VNEPVVVTTQDAFHRQELFRAECTDYPFEQPFHSRCLRRLFRFRNLRRDGWCRTDSHRAAQPSGPLVDFCSTTQHAGTTPKLLVLAREPKLSASTRGRNRARSNRKVSGVCFHILPLDFTTGRRCRHAAVATKRRPRCNSATWPRLEPATPLREKKTWCYQPGAFPHRTSAAVLRLPVAFSTLPVVRAAYLPPTPL
jgi:hypothetical protein